MDVLFTIKHGSHLYGTNTPSSDTDFKGVYMPSADEILLGRIQRSVNRRTNPADSGHRNTSGDVDTEFYSFDRFVRLLEEGQIIAIEMLFAYAEKTANIDVPDVLRDIVYLKHRFLTARMAPFLGYCMRQAGKYGIKGSRIAAARRAYESFRRFTSNVKVHEVLAHDKELPLTEHCGIVPSKTPTGPDLFTCVDRCVPFTASAKTAADLYGRILDEYGKRARAAEANENVDWKAMSHAVRVAYQFLEVLDYGKLTFPRPEARLLVDIKEGKMPYKEVAHMLESMVTLCQQKASDNYRRLPAAVDPGWTDSLILEAYKAVVRSSP